jgi:hypothetical protein
LKEISYETNELPAIAQLVKDIKLKTLHISDYTLSEKRLKILATTLKSSKSLKKFVISSCRMAENLSGRNCRYLKA